MTSERRIGMHDVSEKLGYIAGSLDGLHKKVDAVKDDVSRNSGRISAVEKSQAKARNITIGAIVPVMSVWTYVILQWEKIMIFFGHHGS